MDIGVAAELTGQSLSAEKGHQRAAHGALLHQWQKAKVSIQADGREPERAEASRMLLRGEAGEAGAAGR